ncbi:MAG: HDIG domain-containing metalloprotein, partial [Planctomycetota bacterium]
LEYQAELAQQSLASKAARSFAVLGLYAALFAVCGFFVMKLDATLIDELGRFVPLLLAVVATTVAVLPIYHYESRPEVIPLLIFAMTVTIASRQDLALLLSAAATLIAVVAVGHGLADTIILLLTTSAAVVALDRVRTRSKLLLVGFVAAVVGFFSAVGVGVISGDAPWDAARLGAMIAFWSVIAGSLLTCLLPGIEHVFRVQTDLSLLELGDPSKPLLQELIRRAPGTYNHSITVASLAEAAADSIGARGLLVRVGAYYHDIGKMLKPGYFVENQTQGENRHDALVPAMSTLVIIAHVKDGADLARQNKLPEQIIDFIQQHHGTTLVEYFYRQAADRQTADPDAGEVDESSFRYPGPKPQTRESAVLMIADAVESASRVLVEPTPARIESLVEELIKKRLDDGQFDECGITLQEVRKVGDSLVKSLTAVYHGRVKYPEQDTA